MSDSCFYASMCRFDSKYPNAVSRTIRENTKSRHREQVALLMGNLNGYQISVRARLEGLQ